MKVTVNKWGNSLAIRLPSPVTKELDISEGNIMEIAMDERQQAITLKPVRRRKAGKSGRRMFTEKELLAGLSYGHFDRPEYDVFEADLEEDEEQ